MTVLSNVEAIFFAALEKTDAAERAAYLDQACAGDADLRGRVERLLAARPQVGSFLEVPAPVPRDTGEFLDPTVAVGTVIAGRYKLLEAIGEGGMGTVYMAEQTEPVRRRVAVKLIKPGMDSRQVLARFAAEQQALAMMDHPNIAKVFDAGTTEAGRPFFVMELVKGVPLTKFCDERRLSPRQRLELFVPVCQAVQHAHQKGVIHRDIKPSNVLVALYDGVPVPKVIDFGVAKATGQQLTDKTLFTGFGAVVGTPEYMSPEQAEVNQLDVDTRSDVYSLGVLLYELLTGDTPLDRKRLGKAALLEILRVIREEEPPKPSTRLSTSDALPSIAANRQTEPARLAKLVRGELDWIVMKALEKNRNRRYESASGLAADVLRHLANEPVSAGPPGVFYRLNKFIRRHRTGVAAAGALLVMLLAMSAVVGVLALQAFEARELAVAERLVEAELREAEAEARDHAEKSAEIAKKERILAEAQSDRATKSAAEARRAAAVGQMLAAQAAWREGSADLARQHLNLVPVEQRGWEWRYLKQEYVGGIFVLAGHEDWVYDAAFSPDGSLIATAGRDKTVRLWDARTGRPVACLTGHTDAVKALAFSPDGRLLTSAGADKTARIWDVAARQTVTVLTGHPDGILAVAFAPAGDRIATAGAKHAGIIWDVKSGKSLKVLEGPPVREAADGWDWMSIAWGSGPDVLAIGSSVGNVNLWDAKTWTRMKSISPGLSVDASVFGPSRCAGVCFSPDMTTLVGADIDNHAILWDWRSGREVRRFAEAQTLVNRLKNAEGRRVAISPDGEYLATAGPLGRCMLWSLSSGGLVAELSGHGGLGGNGARLCDVLSVAFSPDGSRLVTTGCDGLARVWNLSAVPHHTTGLVNFTVGGDGRLTAHGTPKRMTWKVNPDVTDLNLTAAPSQEEYERRSALTAPDPAWHAERMDEYIACSRWAPAAFHARQVAASLPWSSEAAVKLGHLRLFANQPDQAAACFARALLLDPASRMYPKSWGWVFEREGDLAAERDDWARAVRNFRAALACETSSSNWPRRKLAAALLATKDTQSLLLLCQESIVTVAKGEEDTVGIDLYLAFPIPEAEERKLVALAARWPGQMKQHSSGIINISTRTLLGAARFRAGETAEARAELAASIETDDSAIAHLFLAMTEYRLGHKEEAKRRLEEANRLPHMGSNQYDEWTLRVCWKTLRQEASELIEGKK